MTKLILDNFVMNPGQIPFQPDFIRWL